MYIYIYVYTYIHMCMCIYVYMCFVWLIWLFPFKGRRRLQRFCRKCAERGYCRSTWVKYMIWKINIIQYKGRPSVPSPNSFHRSEKKKQWTLRRKGWLSDRKNPVSIPDQVSVTKPCLHHEWSRHRCIHPSCHDDHLPLLSCGYEFNGMIKSPFAIDIYRSW